MHRIEGAPTFRTVAHAQGPEAVRDAIDTQRVIAAVQIGPSFSRDIEAGLPTDIEVILDGRKSNASQIVGGYLDEIVTGLAADTPVGQRLAWAAIDIVPRNWFNPNLIYQWFMVPNLIASIALVIRTYRHRPVDRSRARAWHVGPVDHGSAPHQ